MDKQFDKLKVYQQQLSEQDFMRIAKYVEENYGIKMPKHKRMLVQNRLYKRLIALQIPTFEEYVKYIFSPQGAAELNRLSDFLTTNKSEFFREPEHFEILRSLVNNLTGRIKIWSAACATGEEVYSIAMTLYFTGKKYRILGSDLSEASLEIARKGLYRENQLVNLPPGYKEKFFEPKLIDGKQFYQIKKYLFQEIRFVRINLVDRLYGVEVQDIIFLRNVLIYFNLETQNEVIQRILHYLKPGGYLFLGHSESIIDFSLPLNRIAPSVYQKRE